MRPAWLPSLVLTERCRARRELRLSPPHESTNSAATMRRGLAAHGHAEVGGREAAQGQSLPVDDAHLDGDGLDPAAKRLRLSSFTLLRGRPGPSARNRLADAAATTSTLTVPLR